MIPTNDTALLLIDVQNGFLHEQGMVARLCGGTLPETSAASIEPLKATIAAARAQGIPIIYTRHAFRPDMSDTGPIGELYPAMWDDGVGELATLVTGSWEVEIFEPLAPAPADHVIDKNRYDAFLGTTLEQLLTRLGIENLVVGGLVTAGCVESTVRDAAMRDYRVFLVADAVGDIETEVHERGVERLGRIFARLVTSTDVAAAWAGAREEAMA